MAGAAADEELARRFQEQEDAEMARRLERGSPMPNGTSTRYLLHSPVPKDDLEAELRSYMTPEHRHLVDERSRSARGDSSDPIVVNNSPGLTDEEKTLRKLQEEEDLRLAMEVYKREQQEMRVDRLFRGRPASPPPASRYSRPPSRGVSAHYRNSGPSAGPLMPERPVPPFIPRQRGRISGRTRDELETMAAAERALESNDYEALLALEEKMGKVERGLSASQLAAFPLAKWAAPPAQCTICMEEFQQGSPFRTLSCLDKFHPECIDKWLKTHTKCPVCRHDLTE